MRVYCRRLEDGSGYGIFPGLRKLPPVPINRGGRDRWEQCLGVGTTVAGAWKSYRDWKKG